MQKPLVVIYGLFAVAGFGGAVYFGVPYWTSSNASPWEFGRLAYANGPAATLSADLTVVYLLANLWIVVEGRRLKMRHLWLYILANTLVAVAAGLPLFLLAREYALAEEPTPERTRTT